MRNLKGVVVVGIVALSLGVCTALCQQLQGE